VTAVNILCPLKIIKFFGTAGNSPYRSKNSILGDIILILIGLNL
jgi:hypothetical protein